MNDTQNTNELTKKQSGYSVITMRMQRDWWQSVGQFASEHGMTLKQVVVDALNLYMQKNQVSIPDEIAEVKSNLNEMQNKIEKEFSQFNDNLLYRMGCMIGDIRNEIQNTLKDKNNTTV